MFALLIRERKKTSINWKCSEPPTGKSNHICGMVMSGWLVFLSQTFYTLHYYFYLLKCIQILKELYSRAELLCLPNCLLGIKRCNDGNRQLIIIQIDNTNTLTIHFHFPLALASLSKIKLNVLNPFDLHLLITCSFFPQLDEANISDPPIKYSQLFSHWVRLITFSINALTCIILYFKLNPSLITLMPMNFLVLVLSQCLIYLI